MTTVATREFKFIDGDVVIVPADSCRGCYIEVHSESLAPELKPIMQNDKIVVRQDAEFAVPGFYIVALREHIESLADVQPRLASQIGTTTYYIRKAMKECLNIERAHIYLEEKLNGPHYHTWLLPLWDDTMTKFNIDPRLWMGNIREYLGLFTYEEEREKIRLFNERMTRYLKNIEFVRRNFEYDL